MSIGSISAKRLNTSRMLPRWPIEWAPAQNVKVQMEHALACVFTHIGDHPPTPINFHPNAGRDPEYLRKEPGIGRRDLGGRLDMSLGNHQDMSWGDGIDVIERHHIFCFSTSRGGDIARNDRAKQAVSHLDDN